MTIGERLREERERLGLSQTAFAGLVGASKGTQFNYERNSAAPTAIALAVWATVGLDVLYVVMGRREGDSPFAPPTQEEQVLLGYWRNGTKEGRRAAMGALIGAELVIPQLPMARSAPEGRRRDGSTKA